MDDKNTLNYRANDLVDGENLIKVNESDFLPSLELIWRGAKDPIMYNNLFLKGRKGINMTELHTYINPSIVVRDRQ